MRLIVKRILVVVAGIGALLVAAFVAALLWPAPDGLKPLKCGKADGPGCEEASGRVLYALQKDREDASRPLHLVLISKQSVMFPALSGIKIPADRRPQAAPRIGTWVSAVGAVHKGSNGFDNITVERLLVER